MRQQGGGSPACKYYKSDDTRCVLYVSSIDKNAHMSIEIGHIASVARSTWTSRDKNAGQMLRALWV